MCECGCVLVCVSARVSVEYICLIVYLCVYVCVCVCECVYVCICVCAHRFDGLFDEVLLAAQVVVWVGVKHLQQRTKEKAQFCVSELLKDDNNNNNNNTGGKSGKSSSPSLTEQGDASSCG